MNIEEALPSKDVEGMDVIVTDEISASDVEANADPNKNIVTKEYVEEDLPCNDSPKKTASEKSKNETELECFKKIIKTELNHQDISDLVINQDIQNAGFISDSFIRHTDSVSEYTEKDASSPRANCEYSYGDKTISNDDTSQTNTEPNQTVLNFKSFYVEKDSLTPYSDATSGLHDPKKIKRPMNPFMIFAHYERKKILQHKPNLHNASISKTLGTKWKCLSNEAKLPYKQEAERLRQFHIIEYPSYRYQPKKKTKKETFLSAQKPPTQSQNIMTCPGPGYDSSFKITNWFGSNSWINSPVSYLCNGSLRTKNHDKYGRSQTMAINPANMGLKVTIDSKFKASLKNPEHRLARTSPIKSRTLPQTAYYSPAMFHASNLFSSADTSSFSSIQTDIRETREISEGHKSDPNKADIHTIIEEFMSDSNSFDPPTSFQSLYPTPPSTPLDFNELLLQDQQQFDHQMGQDQQFDHQMGQEYPFDHQWDQRQHSGHQWIQDQEFYDCQQPHPSQVLWEKQYLQGHINHRFIQNVNVEYTNQGCTQNVIDENTNQSFTQTVYQEYSNQSYSRGNNEEHSNQSFTQNVNQDHTIPNVKEEHFNQGIVFNASEEHAFKSSTQKNVNANQTINPSFTGSVNDKNNDHNLTLNVKQEHINQTFTQNVQQDQTINQCFTQSVKTEFDPHMAKNIKLEYVYD